MSDRKAAMLLSAEYSVGLRLDYAIIKGGFGICPGKIFH